MQAFEFLKKVDWPITFQILGIRIAVASVILTTIFFVFGNLKITELVQQLFASFVVFALFVGISFPALALNKAGVPFVGLLTYPAWLLCIGDPVVKILHTKRPDLIPLDEFKFLLNHPVIYLEKGEVPSFNERVQYQGNTQSQSYPSSGDVTHQNDFERGKQLFNRGEQKDGLEMVAAFAASNPSHVEANLFMARELANADLHGFAELIRKHAQNVLRNAPSNEEARRILDRLNNTGQSESAQPPQQSTINLAKGTENNTTSGAGEIVRVGWDTFQSAYQSGSSDQKAWVDSEEAGLLARKLVEEASLDSQSTKIRAGLIRVISNYYLRIINQNELAAHIEVESDLSREHAATMASKIVQNVKLS